MISSWPPPVFQKKLSLSSSYSEVVCAAIASHLLAVGCSLSQAPSSSSLSLSPSLVRHMLTPLPPGPNVILYDSSNLLLLRRLPLPTPGLLLVVFLSHPPVLSLSCALATIDHQRQYISLSISRSQPPNPACLLPPNSTHRPLPCFKSASSSSSSSSSSLLSIVAGERRGSGRQ